MRRNEQAEKKAHACNSPAAGNGKSQKEKKGQKSYMLASDTKREDQAKESNLEREKPENWEWWLENRIKTVLEEYMVGENIRMNKRGYEEM